MGTSSTFERGRHTHSYLFKVKYFQRIPSSIMSRNHPKKQSGLHQPLKVSPELAKIINTKEGELITRPQATKKLVTYLKENNLQDPNQKQFYTPNKAMEGIFGKERIKCFSMNKYLKDHLTK